MQQLFSKRHQDPADNHRVLLLGEGGKTHGCQEEGREEARCQEEDREEEVTSFLPS
jgi:hypothetical protein